jgi:hypothetical protein
MTERLLSLWLNKKVLHLQNKNITGYCQVNIHLHDRKKSDSTFIPDRIEIQTPDRQSEGEYITFIARYIDSLPKIP